MDAMLARLDLATFAYHADADRGWRSLVSVTASQGRYADQLMRVYGFEAPLEAALRYTPRLDLVLDPRAYVRTGLIARDLLALGLSPSRIAAIPQCMIAPFRDPAEALGWMYVRERGAFVHDGVRRALVGRLPALGHATSYLGASDDARWVSFADTLERFADTRAVQDRVAAAALDAFRRALDWFGTSYRASSSA